MSGGLLQRKLPERLLGLILHGHQELVTLATGALDAEPQELPESAVLGMSCYYMIAVMMGTVLIYCMHATGCYHACANIHVCACMTCGDIRTKSNVW